MILGEKKIKSIFLEVSRAGTGNDYWIEEKHLRLNLGF
jgi:hypothetical protein